MSCPNRRLSVALLVMVFAAGVLMAQEPPDRPPPAPIPFWDSRQGVSVQAATGLALNGHPLAAAGIRLAGSDQPLLPEWQFLEVGPPPLKAAWLDLVKDKTFMPDMNGGRARDELDRADWAFYDLYCQALGTAALLPAGVFEQGAKENEHVTFVHLLTQSRQYRGQVVPIRGRLLAVRKWDAPRKAQAEGVRYVYEGWIKGPTPKANPFCVIFPELPAGVAVSENLNRPVTFYGYYLKLVSYKAPNADRITPLLIGPTVIVDAPPPGPAGTYAQTVMIWTMGAIMVIAVMVGAMNWYFRRGDRAVQSHLARLREKHAGPGLESDEPPDEGPPLARPVDGPPHQNGITAKPPQPGPAGEPDVHDRP